MKLFKWFESRTCEHCEYATKDESFPDMYSCEKIISSNNVDITYSLNKKQEVDVTCAYSWDGESHSSGNYVGKDFGCNKFKRKNNG